ncbi:hypothetical protein M5362_32670 [Streptomyces sp. Je 1-79]|uniref:hypothetical protein n=1 Tax=Streptomyces sp. Je 1-79 TaxID=2943847 RepID=UPI0021A5EE5B|nr:hypothetical protein [Streptomyces sp. Je 1-79]MCT4357861.1 hypothetical protein [Streptomyces sp. Je 1-79]
MADMPAYGCSGAPGSRKRHRTLKRKAPQEKKRLSYAKVHRNEYGENDKSSRKNIRRNKRFPNGANRRHAQTALAALLGSPDDVRADAVEERMNGRRPKR